MKFLILLLTALPSFSASPDLEKLKVFPGFKVSVYAEGVENARSLALGKDGVVFVGTRSNDKVYALLPDKNKDGISDGVKTIAEGLDTPNGDGFHSVRNAVFVFVG